jgi:O-methyltransferase domain
MAGDGLPPRELITEMTSGMVWTQLLYVAVKLGVPEALRDGSRTARELAEAVGAHADSLGRALRALVVRGVLVEQDGGRFALEPAGRLLLPDDAGSLRRVVIDSVERLWPAIGALLPAVESGQSPHRLAHGIGLFEWLEGRPDESADFGRWMGKRTHALANDLAEAVELVGDCVVDVGGGHGGLLIGLLQARPGLSGVVFDLPNVVAHAAAAVEASGLQDRCRCVGGDFFSAVPPGGDVYLLSWILHDWDDAQAGRILERCRQAMDGESRLLILELLLPERARPVGRLAAQTDPFMRDLAMMINTGGRERSREQLSRLLRQSGLELRRISSMPGRRVAVLEARRPPLTPR